MTSRPWPMAWFQNICTEVFLQWLSTKIAKMALLGWTEWRPQLKIGKNKNFKRHLRSQCPDFKVISQKCSSYGPLSKFLKIVPLGWTKWPPELKNRKPLNDISSLASGLISKWLHRNVPLYHNCQNGSALLNKMVTRAENRKTFKRHLRGQWCGFQNCFTSMFLLCPFAKIAKMVLLCWAKWLPELKIEKKNKKKLKDRISRWTNSEKNLNLF